MNNEFNTELNTEADTTSLDNVTFLHKPVPKHINKLGKGLHKRNQVKGGRTMVGARLTAEQMANVEWLIEVYTERNGTQATVSSVIAELFDKAKAA